MVPVVGSMIGLQVISKIVSNLFKLEMKSQVCYKWLVVYHKDIPEVTYYF